jgi:hypothetical protein
MFHQEGPLRRGDQTNAGGGETIPEGGEEGQGEEKIAQRPSLDDDDPAGVG